MNIDALESYEKVISLEKYFKENNRQIDFIEGVKQGKYTFFEKGDFNWDYYKDKNNWIYAISKEKGALSVYFGTLNYFKRSILKNKKVL